MFIKKNKQFIAFFLVISIFFSFIPAFASEDFATREYTIVSFVEAIGIDNLQNPPVDLSNYNDSKDISSENITAVSLAISNNLIKGYDDNTLRLLDNILRVEALVILSRSLPELDKTINHQGFTDVPDWAKKDINRLAEAGLVLGYGNGVLGANDYITIEQVKILSERILIKQEPSPTISPSPEPVAPLVLPLREPIDSSLKLGPNTDFYTFVNNDWFKKTKVPEYSPVVSAFTDLQNDVSGSLFEYLDKALKRFNTIYKLDNSDEGKIASFLLSATSDEIIRQGDSKLKSLKYEIGRINSPNDLFAKDQTLFYSRGTNYICNFIVNPDLEDSSVYSLYFNTYGTNFTYEQYTDPKFKYIQDAYKDYILKILREIGYSQKRAAEITDDIIKLETDLSQHNFSLDKINNYENSNIRLSIEELDNLFPEVDIQKIFKTLPVSSASFVIVPNIDFVKKLGEIYTMENLETLTHYMLVSQVSDYSFALTENIEIITNDFISKITGIKEPTPALNKRIAMIFNVFSPYFEKKYVNKNYSDKVKDDFSKLVYYILDEYKERIYNIDWLSENTKKNALEKLENMTVNIGYSEDIFNATYPFDISYTNYILNIDNIGKSYVATNASLLNTTVDKSLWAIPAFEINAYYSPQTNSINFPLGILQPPFYDINSTWEEKICMTGFFIAHEITHALDTSGSQFDKNGNLENWWTDQDKENFEKKYQPLIDLFNGFEAVPGHYINGEQCVGENIADLGALSCIIDILSKTSNNPDYKLAFESFAKMMRKESTVEYDIDTITYSSYPTNKERVNLIVLNFDEFYEAYDINENDPMYIPPEHRIKIW